MLALLFLSTGFFILGITLTILQLFAEKILETLCSFLPREQAETVILTTGVICKILFCAITCYIGVILFGWGFTILGFTVYGFVKLFQSRVL